MDQPGHLKVLKSEDIQSSHPPHCHLWGGIMDITPSDTRHLESFEMRCLRVILGVHLMDRVKNEEIRKRLNIPNTICEEVSKRRMKWFGHVVRMPHHRLPLQAYTNEFSQRRPPGRPPTRWRDLFRRLNIRPKEGLNGEGWLVGERRDTPSYASKSSKSNMLQWF